VTRHAENPENAVRLIEFLLSTEAQKTFAEANFEYPVVPGIEAAADVAAWGDFKEDELDLSLLAEYNEEAVSIFDEVGWQ
jgi:iron(III) transport system substrate-binding protein